MEYYDIFTPGAPPKERRFLVGRKEEIERLETYLLSPGIHPIVVGPRGIGKTSLVQQILDEQDRSVVTAQIEANTVSNFDELARCICDDLGIDVHNVSSTSHEMEETMQAKGKLVVAEGQLQHKEKTTEQMIGLSGKEISPQSLKRLLISSNTNAVISLDELDDLPGESDIPVKLAKLAKSLSNQSKWINQKFVFSGIGRDAHTLFGGHLSSQRNHPVIFLDPLKKNDFMAFFSAAEEELGISIPSPIKNEIIQDADGFPYYMHQVCFHMFLCHSKQSPSAIVTDYHYTEGKNKAFEDAFSHYLRKYKYSVYRLSDLQKSILREIVVPKKRHHNYFELEKKVARINNVSVKEAKKAFRKLMDSEYIQYRKSDDTISLNDALLKPFLRIKLNIRGTGRQASLFDG